MKKDKSLYDSNGRWVEERGRIKGAIRRSFRLSPQMREVLQAARVELPPALKKDGKPGKKNQVRYRCAICKDLFSQKNIQVDHIIPVVPLHMPESALTYDDLVRGVFCDKDNLQVVCSTPLKANNGKPSCHRKKTNQENYIRDYLAKIPKNEFRVTDIEKAEKSYILYLAEQEKLRQEKEIRKQERLLKKSKKTK